MLPLNEPKPDSKRAAPTRPRERDARELLGARFGDVGARGDHLARAGEHVGALRQRRRGHRRDLERRRLGQACRGRCQGGAQLGLGQAGEGDERLHGLLALLALLLRDQQALGGAGPRQRGIGARLEAALHAELGQARRLVARGRVEASLRQQRFAGAQAEVLVRGLGRHGHPRVVPRRGGAFGASVGGRARGPRAAEQVELPARLRADRFARAGRQRDVLAAANDVGRRVERRQLRRARSGHPRARLGDACTGAGDGRARRFGGIDQAREERIVELGPPAAQLGRPTALRQRLEPRRSHGARGRRRVGRDRGAGAAGEREGDQGRRERGTCHRGGSLRRRRPAMPARDGQERRGCSRKKRSIAREASGPWGSV